MCHILCPHADQQKAWDKAVMAFANGWKVLIQTQISMHASRQEIQIHYSVLTLLPSLSIMQAALDQDQIGWAHFIKGHVSHQWRLWQEKYYHSQCTAWSWTEGLVSNILTLVHKQWIAHNAASGTCLQWKKASRYVKARNLQWQLTPSSIWTSMVSSLRTNTSSLAAGKWLRTWLLAQEIYESHIESETQQLHNLMHSWMNGE